MMPDLEIAFHISFSTMLETSALRTPYTRLITRQISAATRSGRSFSLGDPWSLCESGKSSSTFK